MNADPRMPDQSEILISRLVDGEASTEEWREFESLAFADPSLWRTLAETRRDKDLICAQFNELAAAADRVNPVPAAVRATHVMAGRFRAWSGWTAAAVIALGWAGLTNIRSNSAGGGGQPQQAGLLPASFTPDEAREVYLTEGRQQGLVVEELPKVLIDSRPIADSDRVEVIFLRQIVERQIVQNVYGFASDDTGVTTLVPISPEEIATGDPL